MTLVLKNISFTRDNRTLFSNINYSIYPGQALQIMGANGSGKSTLLRILAGFLTPETGSIIWQTQCISKQNYQQNLHYIGHLNGLKSHLTLYDNIQLFCSLKRYPIKLNDLHSLADQLAIRHLLPIKTGQFSAGELRRASLMKLLIYPTKLWILDEPLTALDKITQDNVLTLFKTHLANEGMIIAATHQILPLEYSPMILPL